MGARKQEVGGGVLSEEMEIWKLAVRSAIKKSSAFLELVGRSTSHWLHISKKYLF